MRKSITVVLVQNQRLLVRSRDYYAVLYRALPAANSIDAAGRVTSPVWTRYYTLVLTLAKLLLVLGPTTST